LLIPSPQNIVNAYTQVQYTQSTLTTQCNG